MVKYSKEWKFAKRAWVQKHEDERWGKCYRVHWIAYDTEYVGNERYSYRDAVSAKNDQLAYMG